MDDIIFSKKLSKTDTTHRLVLPSEKLKKIAKLSPGEGKRITVMDTTEREWLFRLSTQTKGKFLKPVISGKVWREFVSKKRLQEGDKIILFREKNETNEVRLRIKIEYFKYMLFKAVSI